MAVDECHHSSGRRGSRKNNIIIHYTVTTRHHAEHALRHPLAAVAKHTLPPRATPPL
jgi:hypothetical protein